MTFVYGSKFLGRGPKQKRQCPPNCFTQYLHHDPARKRIIRKVAPKLSPRWLKGVLGGIALGILMYFGLFTANSPPSSPTADFEVLTVQETAPAGIETASLSQPEYIASKTTASANADAMKTLLAVSQDDSTLLLPFETAQSPEASVLTFKDKKLEAAAAVALASPSYSAAISNSVQGTSAIAADAVTPPVHWYLATLTAFTSVLAILVLVVLSTAGSIAIGGGTRKLACVLRPATIG